MYIHIQIALTANNQIEIYWHCTGVEKNNDCAKKNFYSSNRHDPCMEIIQCEKRIEALTDCKREKRKYEKHDEVYWSSRIFERATKQSRVE